MSNYRVVELSPSQYIIEVERVIKKGWWIFAYEEREWLECNVEGTYYGDKYRLTFRGSKLIPKLRPFPYARQARLKISEFERDAILQSLPKVAS